VRVSGRRLCSRRPEALNQQRSQGRYIGRLSVAAAQWRPAFVLRFFGHDAPPPRLSDFDLEQFFTLLSDELAAIRPDFRRDHRLPTG